MKKTNILILAAAMLAFAQAARAGQPDFDGACGAKAPGLNASLAQMAVPEAAAPGAAASCDASAGPVLSLAVEKNATARETFDAEGRQADVKSVRFLINVRSAGADSRWAVGANDKIYSLGAARQAPEFAAVTKLAEALSLTGTAKTRGNKCETTRSYACINGQTNECSVDRCGWCGKWPDGTWGCEWSTESPPYACSPNGMRC